MPPFDGTVLNEYTRGTHGVTHRRHTQVVARVNPNNQKVKDVHRCFNLPLSFTVNVGFGVNEAIATMICNSWANRMHQMFMQEDVLLARAKSGTWFHGWFERYWGREPKLLQMYLDNEDGSDIRKCITRLWELEPLKPEQPPEENDAAAPQASQSEDMDAAVPQVDAVAPQASQPEGSDAAVPPAEEMEPDPEQQEDIDAAASQPFIEESFNSARGLEEFEAS